MSHRTLQDTPILSRTRPTSPRALPHPDDDDDQDTLVLRARGQSPPRDRPSDDELDTLVFRRGVPRPIDPSETPPAVEYEVVGLEDDLEGAPVRPLRPLPEETAPNEAQARRRSLHGLVRMAAAAGIGMLVGAFAQRPATPSLREPPAPAETAAPAPPTPAATMPAATTPGATTPAATAIEATTLETAAIEAPSAPATTSEPAVETSRIPPDVTRPLARTAPAAPESPSSAPATGTEPFLANTPAVTASLPTPPAPDTPPPQQTTAIAIAAAARGAAICFGPGELRRTMAVSVTFAPSGHATQAVIEGGPHRGTAIGSCIAQHLRAAAIKPFEGRAVTIRTSVHIR